MRYFNTHGPVNEAEHFVVSRPALLTDILTQIEKGHYFTIYAPWQMGKTTFLRHLQHQLETRTDYLILTFNFESSEAAPIAEFLDMVYTDIAQQVWQCLQTTSHPQVETIQALSTEKPSTNFYALRNLFRTLQQLIPACQVVLIIDEFDGTPQGAIGRLLQTWREIYLTQPTPRGLQSVILIGIQNIATLNLGRSSPFNIARQVELAGFTLTEVQDLLGQYSAETGQRFAPEVITEIYEQTGGHPFLVNRLAAIITETIAADRHQPISRPHLTLALNQLVEESNYNFEALVRRANEYREEVLNILFGVHYPFNLNTPLVRNLYTYGIIRKNAWGNCHIANPIYGAVLLAAFRSPQMGLQGAILVNGYDFRTHVVNGQLDMHLLLSRFRQFVERRGGAAFQVTPMPAEATGQYLLMAYLDIAVRQIGGDIFTEVDSGEGRLDLIVVHGGRRYIVETKIWRGPSEFDEGLTQLDRYLEREAQTAGYYVVFHARPKVYGKLTYDELEFTLQRPKATVHVYLIRLGLILGEKADLTVDES